MRLRRWTATLALSALVLTGCSGDSEGEGTSTTTPVKPTVIDPTSSDETTTSTDGTTTSPTSEADADSPPEEAKANTKEGAEAFAKWYWEESGDVYRDGDISALRAAASPHCKVCLDSMRAKEADSKKYGVAKENPYRVSVVRSAQDEKGVWRVKVKVTQPEFEYVKDGKATAVVDATEFEVNPELERTTDGWLLRDWLLVQ